MKCPLPTQAYHFFFGILKDLKDEQIQVRIWDTVFLSSHNVMRMVAKPLIFKYNCNIVARMTCSENSISGGVFFLNLANRKH